jgi:hypothetical protein
MKIPSFVKIILAMGIILLFIGTSVTPALPYTKPGCLWVDNKVFHPSGNSASLGSSSSSPWKWAKSAGGTDYDYGCDIAVDIFGNTYITGTYIRSITFGDITLTDEFYPQVFVAKLSSSGVWLWAASSTGMGTPDEYGIAVDLYMNVYITGWFCQEETFGNTTIDGYQGNMFVAKLNTKGDWQWAVSAGRESKLGWSCGVGIAVDFLGNTYVTGPYQGKITFGKTILANPSNQYSDVFVTKVSPRGIWRWATGTTKTSSADNWGFSVAVDFGRNVYVAGFFGENLSFGALNLTSQGGSDVFVAKLNPRGICQWAKSAGGVENDQGLGIAVDRTRNIYLTGGFTDSASFGNTTLTSPLCTMFVAKLDSKGVWQWAKSAGDTGVAIGLSITTDLSRNAYITGWFQGTCAFGQTTLTCFGDIDACVVKLTSDGSWSWATQAGRSEYTVGRGIAVGIGGNVYITGYFRGTTMFGDTTLTSSGEADVFVAKLR